MKGALKLFNGLCTPAQLYFAISCITVLSIYLQNLGCSNRYCVGKYSVNLRHNNIYFFLFKVVYIVIWTFLLNKLCKKGWSNV